MPHWDGRHKIPDTRADFIGEDRRAWRLDLEALSVELVARQRGYAHPDSAWVAGWICYAPDADPIFHSHLLSLSHLGDIAGRPPAKKNFRGATHELIVIACDPQVELGVARPVAVLQPPVFGAQLKAASDHAAIRRIDDTVRQICNGSLNPGDTDQWRAHYGDNGLEVR